MVAVHSVKLTCSEIVRMDRRRHHEGVSDGCGLVRIGAKSGSLSVRQMTGEDGLHQRISGLGAGDHVPDLLVNQLGWNTRIRYRLRDCRISIEHISAGDLIAVSKRDPTQRGEACGERECWLLLGVVTGSARQRAWIGRAARAQLDRHIKQARILGSGEPLALGARRAGYQVA